jgi:trimeric autotransporter adhesin
MTTTRIYQLDEISQNDIDSTHVFPAEDNAGVDTVQITLAQLAQYLFNGASTSDGNDPLDNFPLVIGNGAYAIGDTSMAIGMSNDASNDGDPSNYNSAVGYQNTTYGNWGASAFGYRNHADYSQSSAFGHKNTVTVRHGSAFGDENTVSGEGGAALGRNNASGGYGSLAAGYYNSASGEYSSCVGANNYSGSSYNSQAFGCYNTISAYDLSGNWCTAVGSKNTVFSPDNFFENSDYNGKSTACGYNNFVAGCYNTAVGANNAVETMGFVIKCSAVGFGNTASGYWGASAFGYRNYANDIQCSAFGHKNTANDSGASAFGNGNVASGEESVAFGAYNTASGSCSTACGYYNTASGNHSTACGYDNTASASWGASAVGHENTASQNQASAFGHNNTASGHSSSAFGFQSSASATNASAFGYICTASAANSTALGWGAIARCTSTVNIGGAIINRADNNEGYDPADTFSLYAGVQSVVMSAAVDMTQAVGSVIIASEYNSTGTGFQVGDTVHVNSGNNDAILTVSSVDGGGTPTGWTITNPGTGYTSGSNIATSIISSSGGANAAVNISVAQTVELDVPANCLFYPDEVGLITTGTVSSVTGQPHVSFGWSGTNAGLLASTQTTNLTQVGSRKVFTSLLNHDGQTTLTFSVTQAATATTLACRAYFKGILIENTPIS